MVSKGDIGKQPRRKPKYLQCGELQSIQISAVDSEDDTFRITTKTEVDDLIYSIQSLGLINPPILKKKSSEYIIVSGFRRIAACRNLGWKNVPARKLDSLVADRTCAQYAIAENTLQRELNLVETSRSLLLLSTYFSDNQRLVKTASALGLPDNPVIIKKIKKIGRLPGPVQDGILANTISLPIALELSTFEPHTGIALAGLFEYLKISLNKQREMISFLKEIAMRENISIDKVLKERKLKAILKNIDLDRTQKSREIRLYLRQRRFPAISQAEKAFEKHTKDLNLGNNMGLLPPKDFEGSIYSLNMRFKSLSELKRLHARLDKILQNPVLNKILI
jgi:ParB family chromosome partitioning protein